jgi:hypothetical protein
MLRKALALNPGYSPAHQFLTAAYAMQDHTAEAREALAAYLAIPPPIRRPCYAHTRSRCIRSIWRNASGSMRACAAPGCPRNKLRVQSQE